MANNFDSSAQYPDLQTGNGVQTNGSTLRENVTNCKVRASERTSKPQAGTQWKLPVGYVHPTERGCLVDGQSLPYRHVFAIAVIS